MRNLFLVLVLANLGFAAWYFWILERPSVARTLRDPDVPRIALVSELERPADTMTAATAPPDASETVAPQPSAPVYRCVGIGPFSNLDAIDAARETLRVAGHGALQRAENGEVWMGHWIVLNGVTNQEQADALSEILAEGGIPDTYFDPSGADGDVLSLGIFRQFNRAEAVRVKALEIGVEPVTVQRTRPGTVYWADVTLVDDESIDLTPFQSPGRIVRLEQRECDSL